MINIIGPEPGKFISIFQICFSSARASREVPELFFRLLVSNGYRQ